jgi:tRNA dimethylallyltransferase
VLHGRIRARIERMLDEGWVEEARRVRAHPGFGPTAIQALGYREVLELGDGSVTRETCAEKVAQLTRRFIRRQRTWFRSFGVRWIDPRNATARAEARAVFHVEPA